MATFLVLPISGGSAADSANCMEGASLASLLRVGIRDYDFFRRRAPPAARHRRRPTPISEDVRGFYGGAVIGAKFGGPKTAIRSNTLVIFGAPFGFIKRAGAVINAHAF